jgi:uncharacterized delta-60 repeat protein
MVVQPDGKLIIGGFFSTVRGLVRHGIARLNADGSGDRSFAPGTGADNYVAAVALQPDGKLLIGGAFTNLNGISRPGIARLNGNGSLDFGFDPGAGVGGFSPSPAVLSLVLQPDGRLLIGGQFASVNGEPHHNIARLNPDGSLDRSFNASIGGSYPQVVALAVQADNKVLVAGEWEAIDNEYNFSGIARLNADGTLDYTFFPSSFDVSIGLVQAMALQPDGKVLVSGYLSFLRNVDYYEVEFARLNPDGSPDLSFALDLGLTYPNGPVTSIALQADSKALIAGGFKTLAGTNHVSAARLNIDGSLDISFAPAVGGSLIALQPDGMVLVGNTPGIERLIPSGSLDDSFLAEDAVTRGVYSLALQSDGKVLIGGDLSSGQGTNRTGIGRLNVDGSLDLRFRAQTEQLSGSGRYRGWITSVALQADGKALVAGQFTGINGENRTNIARLNADGSVDTGFRPDLIPSVIYSVAVQTDGKVLAGGVGSRRIPVARLNPDGTFDSSFNPPLTTHSLSGAPDVRGMALQPDGRLLVCGSFGVEDSPGTTNVARLNVDGTLDSSFGVSATAYPNVSYPGDIFALALQPDGKVLVGGYFFTASRTNLARLNADGTLDETFHFTSARGIYGLIPGVLAIALQPDGKVLLGQSEYAGATNVLRLNVDGTLDTSFQVELEPGNGPAFSRISALAFQPDGKLIIGGNFSSANGVADWNVARLIAGIAPRITSQPQDQSITVGEAVIFAVAADGDPPLSYQWRKDGIDLSGAVSPSLTLNNVQQTEAGFYSVLVSNVFGSVSSSNAALRVQAPNPVALVRQLRDLVNSQAPRPQPLNASLNAALAAIERGQTVPAIQQLQAFEHKVQAQVQPVNEPLAGSLIQGAQDVVSVLRGNL